jgi:CheY-like chemotaxis protein
MDNNPQTLSYLSRKPEDKKILVIENDEDLLNVYKTRFEVEGFQVATHTTGQGIIEKIESYKPDLMILDIMLPFMNGLDALEQVRRNPETRNIKVIVVSALSIEADQKRAEDLGVDEYLIKSKIALDNMVEHIKDQLGIHNPIEEDADTILLK